MNRLFRSASDNSWRSYLAWITKNKIAISISFGLMWTMNSWVLLETLPFASKKQSLVSSIWESDRDHQISQLRCYCSFCSEDSRSWVVLRCIYFCVIVLTSNWFIITLFFAPWPDKSNKTAACIDNSTTRRSKAKLMFFFLICASLHLIEKLTLVNWSVPYEALTGAHFAKLLVWTSRTVNASTPTPLTLLFVKANVSLVEQSNLLWCDCCVR